jgi:hypothetical protein
MMLMTTYLARLAPRPSCGLMARAGWRLKHSLASKSGSSILRAGRAALRPPPGPSSVLVKAAAAPAVEPAAGFKELGLSQELLLALEEKLITQPTEIQVRL